MSNMVPQTGKKKRGRLEGCGWGGGGGGKVHSPATLSFADNKNYIDIL